MAVSAALGLGWAPEDLAAFVGANTTGVRSPSAVLATRLDFAELPPPPRPATRRQPWCGQCDERTRLVEQDFNEYGLAASVRRCPCCGTGETSGSGRAR